MNISVVKNRVNFQLITNLVIIASLLCSGELILAQSSSVVLADQSYTPIITVTASGSVRTNLGRNANQLLSIVAPEYPLRARQRRINGWVLVNFAVDENGKVEPGTIGVVDSEGGEVFNEVSIESASQFEFRPRVENGAKVGVSGLHYLFSYTREERLPIARLTNPQNRDYLPLNFITPEYPPAATEDDVEGYVLVEFTVTKEGLPRGIVILDRSPSSIFNESAVNAAERFRFDPRLVDGEPVEAEGAQYLFTYERSD